MTSNFCSYSALAIFVIKMRYIRHTVAERFSNRCDRECILVRSWRSVDTGPFLFRNSRTPLIIPRRHLYLLEIVMLSLRIVFITLLFVYFRAIILKSIFLASGDILSCTTVRPSVLQLQLWNEVFCWYLASINPYNHFRSGFHTSFRVLYCSLVRKPRFDPSVSLLGSCFWFVQ